MVSSLSSQPLILVMAVTAQEAFMRASRHSVMNTNILTRKKRINKSHGLKKKETKQSENNWWTVTVKRCSVGWQLQSLSQREFPQVGLSLWLSAVLYGVTFSKNTCGVIFQENPNNHWFSYLGISTFNSDLFKKMIWRNRNAQDYHLWKQKCSAVQVLLILMSFGILYLPFFLDYNLSFHSFFMSNWHILRHVSNFFSDPSL